jgi:hypothetical protein
MEKLWANPRSRKKAGGESWQATSGSIAAGRLDSNDPANPPISQVSSIMAQSWPRIVTTQKEREFQVGVFQFCFSHIMIPKRLGFM